MVSAAPISTTNITGFFISVRVELYKGCPHRLSKDFPINNGGCARA